MNRTVKNLPRSAEGLCAVCRRRDRGIGVKANHQLLWVCDDPECLDICDRSGSMKQENFTRLEEDAVEQGGAEAGQFLEFLGKTDLAELSDEEWRDFCRHLVGGYRVHLKKLVDTNAAPF